ncbi:MAG: hypothetical protein M1818_006729 [Claussenomyces sp. TS43310]|nr:MAG: hypothetical protein M1818_006729 [Claussenomyces sp. TS43310]
MSAKASGSDAKPTMGNQDRKYTVEQKEEVLRIRKCSPTAFYEILRLEASCSGSDIKKAYRKISLLTHPDKNGHEHADEAFKMVSRAFGVLSDEAKRQKYDRFGGDPDSRFGGGSAPSANPFSGGGFGGGGGGRPPAGGGRMWDDEISPEEMFNRFFGGGGMGGGFGGPFGGGGGGGMFDTGPQFVFNLGGGPGIRVHQFGGARPRRRPREPGAAETPQNMTSSLMSLLPLLVLFIVPLLSSLFSGSASTPAGPQMRFNKPEPPYTAHRLTPKLHVNYYVDPADVVDFTARKFSQLDQTAEINYVKLLRIECQRETEHRQQLWDASQGWFFQDLDKANAAKNYEMRSCTLLHKMGQSRNT